MDQLPDTVHAVMYRKIQLPEKQSNLRIHTYVEHMCVFVD